MKQADSKSEIKKEAERVHESAMYSAQTQFEYSKTWRTVDRWLGGLAAFLAAVSAAGGLSDVFSAQVAGLVALISAGMGAVAVSLGAPKSKTQAHAAGNAYLALQQDARIFIKIDLDQLTSEEAREALSKLVARHQELNATAEIPSKGAWKKAKKGVEDGSQDYQADNE